MTIKTRKKNAFFGRYPSCDMINNAIRFILDGKTDVAISELYFAIQKANGYLHDDIEKSVKEIHHKVCEQRFKS